MQPAIIWFRQDLRLADNVALAQASAGGRPVLPVYVLDDEAAGAWAIGGASRWWLAGSLEALDAALRDRGSRLILRRGRTVDVLPALASEIGAGSIHCTRAYEPYASRLECDLKARSDAVGLSFQRYGGNLLQEPEAVRTKTGEPYRVFTPYWRALGVMPPRVPLAAPRSLRPPDAWPASDELAGWDLRPSKPDWAAGLQATFKPGEAAAGQRLAAFIDGPLVHYASMRDRPDALGTTMLSPHLHFGEISPAQCWHALALARDRIPAVATGAQSLLREIGWREFSYHLLHHWPHITEKPFREEFAAFPWGPDEEGVARHLDAWAKGRTGYPIVDAGMRQLWQTGWMHNRVRMITASFLTKHLLVPWQMGARWFWDTLVDADLASNSASWQWVAGSGADAAPYFRIFNPILQGRKFDPDGDYVRRYLPELGRLPASAIHAPWEASPVELAAAGVRLGDTYPRPIVEHSDARSAALAAYSSMRQTS